MYIVVIGSLDYLFVADPPVNERSTGLLTDVVLVNSSIIECPIVIFLYGMLFLISALEFTSWSQHSVHWNPDDESGLHRNEAQSSAIQMNQNERSERIQPVDSSSHCDHRENALYILDDKLDWNKKVQHGVDRTSVTKTKY